MMFYHFVFTIILSWVNLCASSNPLWNLFVTQSAGLNSHMDPIMLSQGEMPLKDLVLVIDPLEVDEQISQLVEAFESASFGLQVNEGQSHCDNSEDSVAIVDLTTDSISLSYVEEFEPECVWLFTDTEENRDALLKNTPALNSHVVLIRADNRTHVISMTEIYSPDPGNIPAISRHVSGSSDEIWKRRGDLMGTKLNLVYVESPNYIEVSENGTKAVGFVADVLVAISEQLNFTYNLVPSYDGNFGARDENGTWNGMIRMIMDGGYGFGAALTSVTMVRSEVVDYTSILTISSNELWIKTSSAVDYKAFLSMFTVDVWIMTTVTLLLSVFFGYFLGRILYATILPRDSILVSHAMLGLFLQQGSELITTSISIRCVLFSMAAFSVFFFNAFSAHLTSSLTVQTFSDNIRNFADLLAQEDYEFYVVGGSSLAQTFTSAQPGSVRRTLWEEKVLKDEKFHTENFDLIGKYFLESENPAAIYIYSRLMSVWNKKYPGHGCNLRYIQVPGDINFGAFPLPKKSPYKQVLNHVLRAWRESGTDEKNLWEVTGRFEEDLCGQDGSIKFEPFGLSSVTVFFTLLAIGGGISLILFIQEKLSKMNHKSNISYISS